MSPPQSPDPVRKSDRILDGNAIFFIALAAVSVTAVAATKGMATAWQTVQSGLWLLLTIAPMIALGLFLGGLAQELSDPRKIAPQLGESSGWRGLIVAAGLGAITPGGPFAAFPIVYALFLAGADIGAVIAYLTGWSVLALHRVIIWEVPLLGWDFAALRVLASLLLPILAGALARTLARGPLEVTRPEPAKRQGSKPL